MTSTSPPVRAPSDFASPAAAEDAARRSPASFPAAAGAAPSRRAVLRLAAGLAAGVAAPAILGGCQALMPTLPAAAGSGAQAAAARTGLPAGSVPPPTVTSGEFVMPDGARLPYRRWLPGEAEAEVGDAGAARAQDGPEAASAGAAMASPAASVAAEPWAVILALHGFNDSRDAWEIPAPAFQRAGMAIYAPDQRGFGATAMRGRWAGVEVMVSDIGVMARQLRARYPAAKLVLMGESMGGALLMRAATRADAPPADAWVLSAPAVWGRTQMGILLSSGLWIVSGVAPGWQVTGREVPIRVRASDNRDALLRLARDPLTIRNTRFDALRGLTDAMDAAQAAAAQVRVPTLVLRGEKDEIVPGEAMAAMWRRLPPETEGPRRALYPNGYHLLFRDQDRAAPTDDVIAWLRDPGALLPSGADFAAAAWMSGQG